MLNNWLRGKKSRMRRFYLFLSDYYSYDLRLSQREYVFPFLKSLLYARLGQYTKFKMYSDYKKAKKFYENRIKKACGKNWTSQNHIRQHSPQEMSVKQKAESCKRYMSWLKENRERWEKQVTSSKEQVAEKIVVIRRDARWLHDPKRIAEEVEKIRDVHASLDRYMAMHLARMEDHYIKMIRVVCDSAHKIPKSFLLDNSAKRAWTTTKGRQTHSKFCSLLTASTLNSKPRSYDSGHFAQTPTIRSRYTPSASVTHRRKQGDTSSAKSPIISQSLKSAVQNRPCKNPYIPHHRNLQLYPWATDSEIQTAYQQLYKSLEVGSSNFHDSQRSNATAAQALVKKAYSHLYLSHNNRGPGYLYKFFWTADPTISSSEVARRLAESRPLTGSTQMPWFRPYRSPAACLATNSSFCQELVVNLSHKVLDTILPTSISDFIWAKAQDRRLQTYPSAEYGNITFYGACDQAYSVLLPVSQVLPGRWSYYRDSRLAKTPLIKEGYERQLIWMPLVAIHLCMLVALVNVVGKSLVRAVRRSVVKSTWWRVFELMVLPVLGLGASYLLYRVYTEND